MRLYRVHFCYFLISKTHFQLNDLFALQLNCDREEIFNSVFFLYFFFTLFRIRFLLLFVLIFVLFFFFFLFFFFDSTFDREIFSALFILFCVNVYES